jgi:hypothetical protein
MSGRDFFSGLVNKDQKEREIAAKDAAAKGSDGGAAGEKGKSNFLRGFMKPFSKVAAAASESSTTIAAGGSTPGGADTPTASPKTDGTAAHSIPTPPDRVQQQLVQQAATKAKEKEATEGAGTKMKQKFLGLFKSDGQAKEHRDEQAQQKTAAQRTHAPEPIKLELQCVADGSSTSTEKLNPMVGRTIRAEAFLPARVAPPAAGAASDAAPATSPTKQQFTSFKLPAGGVYRWFRASAGAFEQIAESAAPLYTPTLDDVGSKICCQWVRDESVAAASAGSSEPSSDAAQAASQSSFAEIGPVDPDPSLIPASLSLWEGNKASFRCVEVGTDESCAVTIKRTTIRVIAEKDKAVKASFLLMQKPIQNTSEMAAAAIAPPVRFVLDPVDPLRFAIEEGGAVGSSPPGSPLGPPQKTFRGYLVPDAPSSAEKIAKGRRDRDIIACLVRRIIATGSEAAPPEQQLTKPTEQGSEAKEQQQQQQQQQHTREETKEEQPAPTTAAPAAEPDPHSTSDDVFSVNIAPLANGVQGKDDSHASMEVAPQADVAAGPHTPTASAASSSVAPATTKDLLDFSVFHAPPSSSSASASAPEVSPAAVPAATPEAASSSSTAAPVAAADTVAPAPAAATHSPSAASPPISSSPASQLAALTKRISELTAEKDLFKENISLILVEKQNQADTAAREIETLKETVAQRDASIIVLNKQLETQGEEVEAMKLAIQNLSGQMTKMANAEVKLSSEIRTLKNAREQLSSELKLEKTAHASAVETRDAEIVKLQSESKKYQEDYLKTKVDLELTRSELKRLMGVEEKLSRAVEVEKNLRHDLALFKSDLAKFKDIQSKMEAIEMENHLLRKKEKARRGGRERKAESMELQLPGGAESTAGASQGGAPNSTSPPASVGASVTPAGAAAGTPNPGTENVTAAAVHTDVSPAAAASDASVRALSDDMTTHPQAVAVIAPIVSPPIAPAAIHLDPSVADAMELIEPSVSASPTAPRTPSKRALSAEPAAAGIQVPQPSPGRAAKEAAAAQTQLAELRDQHSELQQRFAALELDVLSTKESLSSAQARVSSLESDLRSAESARAEAEERRAAMAKEHEEAVANKNYWKRKCDSLSVSLQKQQGASPSPSQPSQPLSAGRSSAGASVAAGSKRLGLSPSSSSHEISPQRASATSAAFEQQQQQQPKSSDRDKLVSMIHNLQARVKSLEHDNAALQQTLTAYKKTLDNNYQLLKFEREANLILQSRVNGGAGGAAGVAAGLFGRGSKASALQAQFDQAKALANSLSEIVNDKVSPCVPH